MVWLVPADRMETGPSDSLSHPDHIVGPIPMMCDLCGMEMIKTVSSLKHLLNSYSRDPCTFLMIGLPIPEVFSLKHVPVLQSGFPRSRFFSLGL